MKNANNGLDRFYELRTNFIVIGLTGRMQGGAHKTADNLCNENFIEDKGEALESEIDNISKCSINEGRKYTIIKDYISYPENWEKFDRIKHRDIVLLHLLYECKAEKKEDFVKKIINFFNKLGELKNSSKKGFFCSETETESKEFINNTFKDNLLTFDEFFKNTIEFFKLIKARKNFCLELNCELKEHKSKKEFSGYFFSELFNEFSESFIKSLDEYNLYFRLKFFHNLAFYLRKLGNLKIEKIQELERNHENEHSLNHVYTLSKTINYLIKSHRSANSDLINIVIDSLRNSYEINYFRERYSGFYLAAVNRSEKHRKEEIEDKISNSSQKFKNKNGEGFKNILENILEFDETEYKTNDFKKGEFCAPDVANCIQKADYHLYEKLAKEKKEEEETEKIKSKSEQEIVDPDIENKKFDSNSKCPKNFSYISLPLQIIKFVSLIKQPGLVNPSALERNMQTAFTAKLSSGCISRQVGAVVTDKNNSIKAVGWNEVPQNQTPCILRNLNDYEKDDFEEHLIYTKYERSDDKNYKNNKNFKENIKDLLSKSKSSGMQMNGRNCAYCFKTFHNTFENKDNQVHTRSLHAEENAMLQISKYGGQPLKGGKLYTTASPCELCSKKAYQLGIKEIFYIDPYPGIAKKQILKGGNNKDKNPKLYIYQGAIGRGYYKLYEPMMSVKDEISLRSGIKPEKSDESNLEAVKDILANYIKDKPKLKEKLDTKLGESKSMKEFLKIIDKGLND